MHATNLYRLASYGSGSLDTTSLTSNWLWYKHNWFLNWRQNLRLINTHRNILWQHSKKRRPVSRIKVLYETSTNLRLHQILVSPLIITMEILSIKYPWQYITPFYQKR